MQPKKKLNQSNISWEFRKRGEGREVLESPALLRRSFAKAQEGGKHGKLSVLKRAFPSYRLTG